MKTKPSEKEKPADATRDLTAPQPATYLERSAQHNAEAMAARLDNDASRYKEFQEEGKAAGKKIVSAANLGRELGLSFAEYWLPADRAAAENYFNAHYRKPLQMSFAVFNWLIAESKKLPSAARTMEEVFPALQPLLFALELIEQPARDGQQDSHETTPSQAFFIRLQETRVKLEKTLSSLNSWDAATKTEVKKFVTEHEEWIAAVKAKIS